MMGGPKVDEDAEQAVAHSHWAGGDVSVQLSAQIDDSASLSELESALPGCSGRLQVDGCDAGS